MDKRTPLERFFARVAIGHGPGACWSWTGTLNTKGYGRFHLDSQRHMAHRWIYERCCGPIPDGLVIDHLCRNRACQNPAHMEPVTNRENVMRGETIPAANAARTHCLHGHEFTEENTGVGKEGSRRCRACGREYHYSLTPQPEPRPHCTNCNHPVALCDCGANRNSMLKPEPECSRCGGKGRVDEGMTEARYEPCPDCGGDS